MAGLLPCDTQSCFLLGHVLQLIECSAHFVKVNGKLRLRILVRHAKGIQAFDQVLFHGGPRENACVCVVIPDSPLETNQRL